MESNEQKQPPKKRYRYDKLTLVVIDQLGVKHNYVMTAEKLDYLQKQFDAAGVNFMKLLINHSEDKPIILQP